MNAASAEEVYSEDLAGVVVGETAISHVDGARGRLVYRGEPIEQLVERPFEEVLWLVVGGETPAAGLRSCLREFLHAHCRLGDADAAMLRSLPRDLHPMQMLQGVVALQAPDSAQRLPVEAEIEQGLMIAAKVPALIAAWHCLQEGRDLPEAAPGQGMHADFLAMFHGRPAAPEQVRLLDAAQILQLEHGFNAGTFAGRVCASTLAPVQAVLSASIGTLYGRLHGGADQAALEMAMEIGGVERVEAYVRDKLERKEKIMGMGHREYRTLDPRARILKPMAMELCRDGEARRLLDILVRVEEVCQEIFADRGKEIHANVEFYKGAVFYSLGIPPRFFTALFAMARVYGYLAHLREFRGHGRLIRPRARYVGK